MTDDFKKNYLEHMALFETVWQDHDMIDTIEACSTCILQCLEKGGKVVIFGNGGSAADAMHISAEFIGKFKASRKALKVLCLNSNLAAITAIANDSGYENVFSRQIAAYVTKDDLVIGLTTSGRSKNVIKAFEKAKEIGAFGIALCGENGNEICAQQKICIPSADTPRIQELHLFIGHYWAQSAEQYFGNGDLEA